MNQRSLLNPRVVAALVLVILLVGLAAWMRQRDASFATTVVATRPDSGGSATPSTRRPAAASVAEPSPAQSPAPEPSPSPRVIATPRFEIESSSPQAHRTYSIGGPVEVQIPTFPGGMGVPETPAEMLDAAVRSIEIAGPGNSTTVVDSDHRYWLDFQAPASQKTVSLRIVSDYLQLASGQDELVVGVDPGTKVYEIPLSVAPRLPFTPPSDPAQMKSAWEDYLTEAFGIVVEAKMESEY